MNRRGFLRSILALGAAPAIVRVGSLMPLVASKLVTPQRVSQLWAVNQLGGYFYSMNLSEELRRSLQPMAKFREFVETPSGIAVPKTFEWDVEVL